MKQWILMGMVILIVGCTVKLEGNTEQTPIYVKEVKADVLEVKNQEKEEVLSHSDLLSRSKDHYKEAYFFNNSFKEDTVYRFQALNQTQMIYYEIELRPKNVSGEFSNKGMYVSIGYDTLLFSLPSGHFISEGLIQAAEDHKQFGKLSIDDQMWLANDEAVFFVPSKSTQFNFRIDPRAIGLVERWPEVINDFKDPINAEITITIYSLGSYIDPAGNVVDHVAFDYKGIPIHKPHKIKYVYGDAAN